MFSDSTECRKQQASQKEHACIFIEELKDAPRQNSGSGEPPAMQGFINIPLPNVEELPGLEGVVNQMIVSFNIPQ